jgi:hypothetical protein
VSDRRLQDSRLRVVVSGLIGQYPMGGVTWDYIQYVLGLRLMGHDVYYLEDTGQWPYDPTAEGLSGRPEAVVAHLRSVMGAFGLRDRWMYRFPHGPRWFGLADHRRERVLDSADVVIDVSGVLRAPHEYRRAGRLVYVDTDPVFTQLKLVRGQPEFRRHVDAHDVHFSFGELIGPGRANGVPATGHRWIPTRQPVVLDEWRPPPDTVVRDAFTTVMNWTSYKPIVHDGRTFGQKDVEMERFVSLPSLVEAPLELAVAPGKTRRTPYGSLRRSGWHVVDPNVVCSDAPSYRDYVQRSAAEWSVAKEGYVVGRSGWFSCRTACYLAAGRPAVVQDTGFSHLMPVGEGLLAFETLEEARDGIAAVVADQARHSSAAADLATEWFDSSRVLADLLDAALASLPSSEPRR